MEGYFFYCHLDIWRARNRAVFDLKMMKSFSIYNSFYVDWVATNLILQGKGKARMRDYTYAQHVWTAPPADHLKLNTDGAWKGLSVAGVVAFSEGLLAIREGLIMAVVYKVEKLQMLCLC